MKHRTALLKTLLWLSALLFARQAVAASPDLFDFPIVTDVLCGAHRYLTSKFAPLVAVLVLGGAGIAHWLGQGKFWGTLIVVMLILGAVIGLGTVIARFSGVAVSCLAVIGGP